MRNNEMIQDYILKDQAIYVGLEDSKKSWKLCIRSMGIVINETSMPANYENLKNFFIRRFPRCSIRVLYEAGFSGFTLHDRLQADGWACVVTPPNKVTQEKCQRQKNDRTDSRRLARVLETGDYHICHAPDRIDREDRQIARLYDQNLKDIRQACNRFRRLLEFHGLGQFFRPGKWTSRSYREAWEACDRMELTDSIRYAVDEARSKIQFLWDTKKRILERLKLLSASERYRDDVVLLVTSPGIGWLTAIRILLELGPIERFPRKEQFVQYLGLVPSEYSSGETVRKGHITKEGSRYIRSWLVESAWIAIKKDPALLAKYRRILGHSGSSKKAIVAVARSMAIRIRAMLVTRQSYILGKIN